MGNWLATSILAVGFSIQLILIATNYVRIIHHVRRKFWQRKARGTFLCYIQGKFQNFSGTGSSSGTAF